MQHICSSNHLSSRYSFIGYNLAPFSHPLFQHHNLLISKPNGRYSGLILFYFPTPFLTFGSFPLFYLLPHLTWVKTLLSLFFCFIWIFSSSPNLPNIRFDVPPFLCCLALSHHLPSSQKGRFRPCPVTPNLCLWLRTFLWSPAPNI